VLSGLRGVGGHRFLVNDVSMTVARRHGVGLVTFDAGLAELAGGGEVELLGA
jgi:uncharacterized protein